MRHAENSEATHASVKHIVSVAKIPYGRRILEECYNSYKLIVYNGPELDVLGHIL